jgi:hypothetical protein
MRKGWLFVAITALFLSAGCGGGAGLVTPPPTGGQLGVDNQPPTVIGRLISDTQSGQFLELYFLGGTVQLEATVTAPSGIALVEFSVNPPLSDSDSDLPRSLKPDNQGRVTTSITLPPNIATTNQSYQFQLRVRDKRGNEATVIVGTVVVRSPFAGIPPVPPPPTFSD